ncbi:hypothetical protein [Lysobacter panacisoli]|uniref:Uncharacterized protein n=1 Tax=Lysobacter panacisoli TaxID=1255263 RepID=A0ABP9LPX9_9GAMM|nr:hypothetical protein [Lysobacter panacisoli]
METASRMCAAVLFLAGTMPALATTGTIEFRGEIVVPTVGAAHDARVPLAADAPSLQRTVEPLDTVGRGPLVDYYVGYMRERGVERDSLRLITVAYD